MEDLLEKAKQGELKGWMGIASMRAGDDQVTVCGSFADRLQSAVYSGTKAMAMLVEHVAQQPGVGHSQSGPLNGTQPTAAPPDPAGALPPRFRKA